MTDDGKLPGMSKVGAMDGRTWRTVEWPGEAPKLWGEVSPKLMVLSLRKVKVPGAEGDAGTAFLVDWTGGSGSGLAKDKSGYDTSSSSPASSPVMTLSNVG
jgi:hypothetical protein